MDLTSLPKDVLALLALDLPYSDIMNLCRTSKKVNRNVCQQDSFWRNKLSKDFAGAKVPKGVNPRRYYLIFLEDLWKEPDVERGFYKPVIIEQEMINFLRGADFGNLNYKGLTVNQLLEPLLSRRVMSRVLLQFLMGVYYKTHPELKTNRLYKTDDWIDRNFNHPGLNKDGFRFSVFSLLINAYIRKNGTLEDMATLQYEQTRGLLKGITEVIRDMLV